MPSTPVNKPTILKTAARPPRIVYIGGFGRSGSTVLDMLLGAHPRLFGAGEVTHVFDWWLRNDTCSCGRAFRTCPLWSEVMGRLRSRLPGMALRAAARITRRVENAFGGHMLLAPRRTETLRRYGEIWREVMAGIQAASGAGVIVDSSKTTRLVARRASALAAVCGLAVDLVHLVRDPRAVLWSTLRGSNRRLESDQPPRVRGDIGRMLIGWYGANVGVDGLARATGARVHRLRYEDLVAEPTLELQRLSDALGLDLDGGIPALGSDHRLGPDHGVAGNRLRRKGLENLRLDDEWKTKLPPYARALARLSWPLARRYGYFLEPE